MVYAYAIIHKVKQTMQNRLSIYHKNISYTKRDYKTTQLTLDQSTVGQITRVSCQKCPTCHAYAWQIGPFWQDTLDNGLLLDSIHVLPKLSNNCWTLDDWKKTQLLSQLMQCLWRIVIIQ